MFRFNVENIKLIFRIKSCCFLTGCFYVFCNFIFLNSLFASHFSDNDKVRKECLKVFSVFNCESQDKCHELVSFNPKKGRGFEDYPINGETEENQYRSFIQKFVMKHIQYATGMVDCMASTWQGQGGPLGLGDMSEEDGTTPKSPPPWKRNPGVKIQLGHPESTHVKGLDMDIAYFQTKNTFGNNQLRSVCENFENIELEGKIKKINRYHCLSEPNTLDLNRTALFIAFLHDHPGLRVIGVDGKIGPLVLKKINDLCSQGYYSGPACQSTSRRIAFEIQDEGRGWFKFHHHHLHVSMKSMQSFTSFPSSGLGNLNSFHHLLPIWESLENDKEEQSSYEPLVDPLVQDTDYKKGHL